ncbi:hypothetical protein CCM_09581 [Cordyceps militaris CM01]|uniref:Uncharacterized protein n=1 Tax=Cordyceps militaris (strain CM01) TaxID=983644 RepID=G3JUU0_CORMM|nr:uncharacterized protein CCM_09581 [Cordyceps militaris CM01]EGX87958.1 hypothetical protein CCM_09581 [Cordyceps militaris CM01]
MASAIKGNSQKAFLSLRARLRTPECSSQQFSGRVAKTAQQDGSRFQDYLQRELFKVLSAHLTQEKRRSGTLANENYSLLEQLANSLAVSGSNLYHQTMKDLRNNSETIQSKIDELNHESMAALGKSAKLYHVLAKPLAELLDSGGDGQEDIVPEQMSSLQEEFSKSDERIEYLHGQWLSCVHAEQQAWKRLTDDEDDPRPELEVQGIMDSMEELMANAETEIQNIEAEYAEYIQVESLKVMQTLMEG